MAIVVQIHIKHVHLSLSYQWVIYQNYDRRGHESPRGYWPSGTSLNHWQHGSVIGLGMRKGAKRCLTLQGIGETS